MAYQAVFKRYELKYLIDREQKARILAAMEPYMAPDRYGRTTIRNLYFDTDDYRLIRRSIERPVYKEKLRLRSYRQAGADSTVFVELKKKYNGVVCKRRVGLPEQDAMDWLAGRTPCQVKNQITDEIDYVLGYYGTLHPVAFLSYEREAWECRNGGCFRVTFDEQILCRREALSLRAGIRGTPLLEAGKVLMEIKCAGGIPLWMAQLLSRERISKTSFSKYGIAYQTIIFPKTKGGFLYA